jgi:hypothetical protein
MGISTGITYNFLNLPHILSVSNTSGSVTNTYTYAADGRLLTAARGSATAKYADNMIYKGSTLKRILVDGEYIEGSTYYFYLTDHLGNNRVVANMNGAVNSGLSEEGRTQTYSHEANGHAYTYIKTNGDRKQASHPFILYPIVAYE